ncbi:hypothetical protein ACQB60_33420 [Actinomycetota bacterium Odt1-20B]
MGDLLSGVLSGLAIGTCVTYPLLLWLTRNLRGLPPSRRERRARAELDTFFKGQLP